MLYTNSPISRTKKIKRFLLCASTMNVISATQSVTHDHTFLLCFYNYEWLKETSFQNNQLVSNPSTYIPWNNCFQEPFCLTYFWGHEKFVSHKAFKVHWGQDRWISNLWSTVSSFFPPLTQSYLPLEPQLSLAILLTVALQLTSLCLLLLHL